MFKKILSLVFSVLFIFSSIFFSIRAYDPPKEAIDLGVKTFQESSTGMLPPYLSTHRLLRDLKESGLLAEALDPEIPAVPVVFSMETLLLELFNNSESREFSYAKKLYLLIKFLELGNPSEEHISRILSNPFISINDFYDALLKTNHITPLEVSKRVLRLMAEIYNARFKRCSELFTMA